MAVQVNTKKVDRIKSDEVLLNKISSELQEMNAERLMEQFKNLEKTYSRIESGERGMFIKIEDKPFYYFTEGKFYIADPSRYQIPNEGTVPENVNGVPTSCISWRNYDFLFSNSKNCPVFADYDSEGYRTITNKDGSSYIYVVVYNSPYYYDKFIGDYGDSSNYAHYWGDPKAIFNNVLRLPVSVCSGFYNAVKYGLVPEIFDEFEKKLFDLIMDYNNKGWLVWDNNTISCFDRTFYSALKNYDVDDFEDFCFKQDSVHEYIKENTVHLTEDVFKDICQHFLETDHLRINLTPYEESRLTDPNGGHWDLWVDSEDDDKDTIHIDKALYGRNPVADVKMDGIVGIDFGTKSTVVTLQNGNETILPMRIGCEDLKKDIAPSDYENPTVMEFIDLERFLRDYNLSACRPETKWTDLTVSHTAAESMKSPESGDEYYAWFSDLKRWASDKNRKIIIKDKQGVEKELEPFIDINESDFNPIEYYAYLLGLYINNMYNGIYINYLLSFPATFERRIKQRIIQSFQTGLKKTLPEAVLHDKDIMSQFRVMEGASEPAAYAVCALKEYGFAPAENEKVLYGIFDFGGGTTDFDFGIWQRAPKKLQRRYDYVISHFGAGGDRLLGGENILELLAYEVFKNNEKLLRDKNIQFLKPEDADRFCDLFEGSEVLISDSQQARINTRKLAEELRPLWHGEEVNNTEISVELYDSNNQKSEVKLAVDIESLKSLIRKRIDCGVENFFKAMEKAITKEIAEGVSQINIFLAGNSSKSEYVKESFKEFFNKYNKMFSDKLGISHGEEKKEKPAYFVKSYAEIWEEMIGWIDEFYGSVYIPENVPETDSFIAELSGKDFCNLITCIADLTGCPESVMIEVLYTIWSEGFITANKMNDMVSELWNSNWNMDADDSSAIADFIYSNAETSSETRKELA